MVVCQKLHSFTDFIPFNSHENFFFMEWGKKSFHDSEPEVFELWKKVILADFEALISL